MAWGGTYETGDDGHYQYGAHLIFARDSSEAHGGSWSQKLTRQNFTEWEGIANDNINAGIVPLVPGQVYVANSWVKVGTASLSLIRLRLDATGGTSEEVTTPAETVGAWNRFTVTHTVTGDTDFVAATYHDGSTTHNGHTFWVDDFTVELVAATRTPKPFVTQANRRGW